MSRGTATAGLAVLLACELLVCLPVLAWLVHDTQRRGRHQAPGSSLNAGPDGLRAAALMLAELGRAGEPLTRSYAALRAEGAPAVLIVAGRPRRPVAAWERDALAAWIRRGGRLLLAGAPSPLPRELGIEIEPARACLPDDECVAWQPEGPGRLVLAGSGGGLRWDAARLSGPARTLYREQGRPVVASLPLGAGQVVALASAEPLTNAALAHGGHAALLAELTAGGPVGFDEYHLGHGAEPGVLGYLAQRGLLAPLPQLVLLALLWLWRAQIALATRRPEEPHAASSPTPLVDGLARLYRAALPPPAAVRLLLHHGLDRLTRSLRRPRPLRTLDDLTRAVQDRPDLRARVLRLAQLAARVPAQRTRHADELLVELATTLDALEDHHEHP